LVLDEVMTKIFKSKTERDAHLKYYDELKEIARSFTKYGVPDEIREEKQAAANKVSDEHFKSFPTFQFSVCPICSAKYEHTMDPFGFDGLFWCGMTNRVETNCEHACLIRSAYICRRTPESPYFNSRVYLGPEIPYVIPRILKMPAMQAVISQIDLDNGDTLYAIAYFSIQEFGVRELTAHWDHDQYEACEPPTDVWDFNLRPWVESGKLRWCENTENGLVFSNAPADACPFYEMKGHIGRQFITPKGRLNKARPARRHIRPEGYEE
jgi:hypothetical protein